MLCPSRALLLSWLLINCGGDSATGELSFVQFLGLSNVDGISGQSKLQNRDPETQRKENEDMMPQGGMVEEKGLL